MYDDNNKPRSFEHLKNWIELFYESRNKNNGKPYLCYDWNDDDWK